MGKSVQPPQTPNFQASAADQAAANKEAALWSAQTSNPNVVNPIYSQRVTWQGNIPTVTQGFNPNTQAGQQAAQAQAYQYTAYNLLNQLAANRTAAVGNILNQPFNLYGFGQQQQQPMSRQQQPYQLQPFMRQQQYQQPQQYYNQQPQQPQQRQVFRNQAASGFSYNQPTQQYTQPTQPLPPQLASRIGQGIQQVPQPQITNPIGSSPQPQATQPQPTSNQPPVTQPSQGDWEKFLATGTATQRQYVDNYWNSLPSQVQALRNLPANSQERIDLAKKLSGQGFAIDPQIMIEGQDPFMSIKNRMDAGYTWSPALGQSAPPVAPGLTFPGQPSYDPNNPPSGSIPLNLDFAKGMNVVFPWGGWDSSGKPFSAGTVPSTWKVS